MRVSPLSFSHHASVCRSPLGVFSLFLALLFACCPNEERRDAVSGFPFQKLSIEGLSASLPARDTQGERETYTEEAEGGREMEITVDMHRGASGGGTEEEAERRNRRPAHLMPSPLDSSSLTKTCAPAVHSVLPAGALRCIDNSTSRQVTFSKRRTGLFKKAYELSVLCEAQVAVIIFSSSNRMYEYASSSMLDILERYRQWNSIDLPPTDHLLLQDREKWRHEALYLQQRLKYLTDLQSYMMGENLSSLSLSDLQMVESTLGVGLNRITARKMELLRVDNRTISEKDSFLRLQEENKFLKRKVAELTAISSDTEKTSSTVGTACSGTISECNAMTSSRAAHTSDDDCHDVITLKLGL